MTNYRIGVPAATIVGLRLGFDGTISPIIRERARDGTMVDVPARQLQSASNVSAAEFTVQVEKNHVGVVELVPSGSAPACNRAVFPLGTEKPFLESELPPSPGSNGAYSVTEEVAFRFVGGVLSWEAQNMTGRAVLNASHPELSLVLRLPAGNRGSVRFATPIFSSPDGTPQNVIAAA